MKVNDLHYAIEILGQQRYPLNDSVQSNTYILEYNANERVWEYYYLDERGGKSDLKIFITEDEACKYVLNRAIEYIENSMKSIIYKLKRAYVYETFAYLSPVLKSIQPILLGNIILAIKKELSRYEDDYSYLTSVLMNYRLMPFGNIILAIKELGRYKDDYLKKLDRNYIGRVYESEYNTSKKAWEYELVHPLDQGKPFDEVFTKEAEVCQYAIDRAIGILRDFGEAWKERIVEKQIKNSRSHGRKSGNA